MDSGRIGRTDTIYAFRRPMASDVAISRIVHPPRDGILPGFPRAYRIKGKIMFAGGLRRRWRDPGGTIYEWDYQHGTVEVYDARGFHRGEFDPFAGERVGPPIPGRTVEP